MVHHLLEGNVRLTIGKLAHQANMTPITIRYYEELSLISPEAKTESGYRLYSHKTIRILKFIQNAKLFGFTLKEIQRMVDLKKKGLDSDAILHVAVQEKLHALEQEIQDLQEKHRLLTESVAIIGNDLNQIT